MNVPLGNVPMRQVIKFLIVGLFVLLFTLPLAAQDTSGHEVALQRIEAARDSQATVLDLSGLGLTEIPAEIGQLTHLRELYANSNSLTHVPVELMQLQNLTRLEMSHNQFYDIPAEIFALTNLERLVLYYNWIRSVPARIERLQNLTFLGLSVNEISYLPPEIGQLTNLTQLHLEINWLTSLPPEIGNLTNLCVLHLWDNDLTRLPAEMGQLTRLADPDCNEMLIHNNPLISPPPSVVRQGTGAILAYLHGKHQNQMNEWLVSGLAMLAVVLLVSMGGVITYRSASASQGKTKRKRS
jgi:Leucine-rich repeat (LRR) protein